MKYKNKLYYTGGYNVAYTSCMWKIILCTRLTVNTVLKDIEQSRDLYLKLTYCS